MKVLIARTSAHIINIKTYNCQELGLAKALSRLGHVVSIVTPDLKESFEEYEVNEGIPVRVHYVKKISLNMYLCWQFNVKNILLQEQPDVICMNGFNSVMGVYYTNWAKANNKRIFSLQGNYDTTHRPFFKLLELLSLNTIGRYTLSHVSRIGAKTLWARDFTKRFTNRNVYLTRIGLDDSKFVDYDNIDWRGRLNIGDKKVLLYVGVHEPRRNPLFLVDIVSKLPGDYVLVMVGTGPSVEKVNQIITEQNLYDKVIQLGQLCQNQLPSLYKTSNLFLLASSYEIYGMVILESMYFGLPVISTLTAGASTIIESGKDGIIMKKMNAQDWVNTITELMTNTNKYDQMRKSANKKIENSLIWDKTVHEFLNAF